MNVIVETLVNDSYKLLEFTRATISSLLKKLKENGLIEDYSKDKKYKLTSDGIRCVKIIRKL